MKSLTQRLTSPLTSARSDGFVGQILCYLAALGVLLVGLGALPRLVDTRAEMLLGVCLVLVLALLLTVLGTLLRILALIQSKPDEQS